MITITDIDTGNTDSVDILVEEKKVTFDMVSNCTIGDRLLIKGYANAGYWVDIAIEDEVLPWLDDLVIKKNGEFSRWIETYYYVLGSTKIAAYIDRVLGPGTISPFEKDDGNTTVLLTNPTLSAYLSKDEVFKETGFRIWGIAPGAKSVDILTISPRGGNGTGLEGDIPLFRGTNVTGITYRTLSVSESDHGFLRIMWVHPDADSGTYAIMVTTPGVNGTYDGVNNLHLLEGIIETYCDGNPEVLASMNREELVEMIKNATINASGSDDLLNELCLSVNPELGDKFDTGPGTYPSIMGTHKGEIKPSYNISVSKLYTYSCAGTGGHIESIELYENTTLIASGTWNGYQSDWHNITINPSVILQVGHTYNYTIVTGSYPQIIHEQSKNVTGGIITCTEFVDANGKIYTDWIPAIRLE
jgi:hypothetical protein